MLSARFHTRTAVAATSLPASVGLLCRCRAASICVALSAPPRCRMRVVAAAQARKAATDSTEAASQLYARDQLLKQLLRAKSQEELGSLVAENVLIFDQSFWMRLALRHDEAESEEQKAALSSLASTVAALVEAIVKASEGQAVESAQVLQQILTAAADENGEWHMPLPEAQAASFEKALDDNEDKLDEALLSNVFAWMRKCKDDGLTDVYMLLQQLLQKYAARALVKGAPSGDKVEAALNEVIRSDSSRWESLLMRQAAQQGIRHSALATALQKRMEQVVLSETSGSHSQRVQAEYLKEIEEVASKAKLPGSK